MLLKEVRTQIGCLRAAYFFAPMLALSWLLPEVVQPWPGFEHEAWCAVVFALAGGYLLRQYSGRWRAPPAFGALLLLAGLPLMQWLGGVSAVAPIFALSSLYLFGFALVYLFAFNAELRSPGRVLDAMFFAIGLAAIASVFIALRQWFEIFGPWDWWSLGLQPYRPFANLGQANHLGTLLCWGLCALGWGALRGQIGWPVGVTTACLLVFGIALTGSRSAWLGLSGCLIAVWVWRRLWPSSQVPRCGVLLWLGLAASAVGVNIAFTADGSIGPIDQRFMGVSDSPRLQLWGTLAIAAIHRPWLGYGWNQSLSAYLEIAPNLAPLHGWSPSAHNIALDMVLWCGIPLGLALCALLGWGLFRRLVRVADASQAVLMLFVLLLTNHAMLEYPLHYAYFLLPLACALGCLDAKQRGDIQTIAVRRAWVGAGWLAVSCALALVLAGYREVQAAKSSLLQAQAQESESRSIFASSALLHPLEYWLEQMRALYSPPIKGLSGDALNRLENITRVSVNGNKVLRLAMLLAVNDQPERAVWWLQRFCSIVDEVSCGQGQRYWQERGQRYPEIAALPWPVEAPPPALR